MINTVETTVLHITPNPKPGNIRAFASIQIGNLIEIHGIKIIQQHGQRAYVRLPDTQSNGHWFPVVKCIDPTLDAQITTAILMAWEVAK